MINGDEVRGPGRLFQKGISGGFWVAFEIMITCIEIGRELFVPAYREVMSESK